MARWNRLSGELASASEEFPPGVGSTSQSRDTPGVEKTAPSSCAVCLNGGDRSSSGALRCDIDVSRIRRGRASCAGRRWSLLHSSRDVTRDPRVSPLWGRPCGPTRRLAPSSGGLLRQSTWRSSTAVCPGRCQPRALSGRSAGSTGSSGSVTVVASRMSRDDAPTSIRNSPPSRRHAPWAAPPSIAESQ